MGPVPGSDRSRILGKEGCYSRYHEVKLGATRSWDYSPLINFISISMRVNWIDIDRLQGLT